MAVFLVHPSFISILEQFAELRERERGEAAPPRVDPCLSQLSLRLPVNLSSSSLWRLGWAAEGGAGVQLRWSRAGAAFPSAFSGWAGSGASSGQSPPSFHAVAHFSDRSKFNSFFFLLCNCGPLVFSAPCCGQNKQCAVGRFCFQFLSGPNETVNHRKLAAPTWYFRPNR